MVWTHRDPADVVVSIASLNAALHRVSRTPWIRVGVADHWWSASVGMVDRAHDLPRRPP